jgi:hypothetical protein
MKGLEEGRRIVKLYRPYYGTLPILPTVIAYYVYNLYIFYKSNMKNIMK